MKTVLKFGFLCVAFLTILSGCGSGDSNTTGQLGVAVTRTDLTGGVFQVQAVATYTNSAHTGSLQGQPITITMSAHTKSGTPVVTTNDLRADSSGQVFSSITVAQTNETIFVDVTAVSGGLTATATSVSIPSIAVMTTSPTVVGFPATAVAGDSQTITIAGGLAPYNAQLDAAHSADFLVTVQGNTVTLTKLKASVLNGPAISAVLTITDSSGATPITVPVSYE